MFFISFFLLNLCKKIKKIWFKILKENDEKKLKNYMKYLKKVNFKNI
jgi:hypothetical protein